MDNTSDLKQMLELFAEKLGSSDKKKKNKDDKPVRQFAAVAESPGELIDNEFDRFVLKGRLKIDDATDEIKKLNDYVKYYNSYTEKVFKLTNEQINNGAERCYKKLGVQAVEHIKIKIKYNGSSMWDGAVKEIEKIIEPCLADPTQSLVVAYAIAHWMWQVKRRIYGLAVKNHLSIGFINSGLGSGGQGSGKSTLAGNICRPFHSDDLYRSFLYADITLSDLTDQKAWADTLSRYVLFLDDISPESKAEVAVVKSILTSNGVKNCRGLYQKRMSDAKVNCSAIFTANCDNFGDIIKDKTGNRRYLPIHLKNLHGVIAEDFDFTPIWQMIDENWKCFTDQSFFVKLQGKHETKSSLDLLLDNYECEPGNDSCTMTKEISPVDIKLVLNKTFPMEKQLDTTQSVTKVMTRRNYAKNPNGGHRKKQLVYLIKFSEDGYKRWCENFKDNEDQSAHTPPWSK